ncbi:MAG: CHASE2 domain-containing protein, partial [Verrucomicrobiales bacterium]|nr:CHASE2 domain-containing protein [Verrucomicrobiales bacterium]
RGIHAALIDRLREWGARAVVFDVVFDQPQDAHPEQDRALVEAARRWTNVIVAGERRDIEKDDLRLLGNVGPFPELEAVTTWGVSWFPARVDEVVRRAYLGNEQKESLAAVVARHFGREPPKRGSGAWLNYYGPPSSLPWHSYADVMQDRVPPTAFADKIVFVGAAYDLGYPGGRRLDDLPTPYTALTGRRAAGVEVVATAALNFLRGESLWRTPWYIEVPVLAGFGVAAAFGLIRVRMRWAWVVVLAAAVSVAGAASVAVWSKGIWFPWLTVCMAQLPVAFAWRLWLSALHLRRVSRARAAASQVDAAGDGSPAGAGPVSEAGRVMPSEPAPLPGAPRGTTVSIPDFRLMRIIGRGAYGTVWLARDAIGLARAVKVVERRSFGDARPYEREFEGIRKFMPISLEHPGLIRVFHVGRDDAAGHFYYVMELADDVRGRDLRDTASEADYEPKTLEAELKRCGKLEPRAALRLGLNLGEALRFLHGHQLIHRDIKPANVLFVRGEHRLGDIGLVTGMAPRDGRVSFLGTKGYMAPEGPGTAAADVYSLGKLLFVAATGSDPEAATSTADPRGGPGGNEDNGAGGDAGILLGLRSVWEKACEPDAARRLPTVDAWLSALRGLVPDGEGSSAGTGGDAEARR